MKPYCLFLGVNVQYNQQAVGGTGDTQPGGAHPPLSAHEQRELDDLIRGNYDLLNQQQITQSTSGSGGHEQHVRALVPILSCTV